MMDLFTVIKSQLSMLAITVKTTAMLANIIKKKRGENMFSFHFESFRNRLVIKYFAGDFSRDFKLIRAVCKEVLYSRNPIFAFPDPGNEKLKINADINLDDENYITIYLYKPGTIDRGRPGHIEAITAENITFTNIQEWADEVKKYIEGEVNKYDVFLGYLKVHEQLTKG